jgi:cell wall assembly regulator SMI1
MWRELIQALDADAEFHPPVSAEQVRQAESALSQRLPSDLVALLQESNGAEVSYGEGLVWPLDGIVENNLRLRKEWHPGGEMDGRMPVDHLLFFGESSNGDLYAFPIAPEGVRNQVFIWDHEDDSRRCEANSLYEWLISGSSTSEES